MEYIAHGLVEVYETCSLWARSSPWKAGIQPASLLLCPTASSEAADMYKLQAPLIKLSPVTN